MTLPSECFSVSCLPITASILLHFKGFVSFLGLFVYINRLCFLDSLHITRPLHCMPFTISVFIHFKHLASFLESFRYFLYVYIIFHIFQHHCSFILCTHIVIHQNYGISGPLHCEQHFQPHLFFGLLSITSGCFRLLCVLHTSWIIQYFIS